MKKKTFTTDTRLLAMLRERQAKQGISYLKTSDTVYKFFRVFFVLSWAVCTLINLVYILGTAVQLGTNLSFMDTLNDFQRAEVNEIKNSLYAVGIMGLLVLLSLLFMLVHRPAWQLGAVALSAPLLLLTFGMRLSQDLNAGNTASFVLRHVVPLSLYFICGLVTGLIATRQKHLDKKGCDEIAEKIYISCSKTAENITPEQWETILAEYVAQPNVRQKRGKKHAAQQKTEV